MASWSTGVAPLLTGVLLGVLAGACKRAPAPEQVPIAVREIDMPVEVMTWWGPLGQSDPVAALARVNRKRNPHDLFVDEKTMQFPDRMHKTLAQRLDAGEPPDVFQVNVGMDQLLWVVRNGLDAREARILPVDGVPEVAAMRKALPARLLPYMTYDGKLYGVPATIHRINTLYYNKRVLREHDIPPPRSVDDLLAAGKKLDAAGVPLLAVGTQDPWALSWFIMESLLVGLEGPDFYDSYFDGGMAPDDPRMLHTLDVALDLLRYANRDAAAVTWLQAANLVRDGRAAVTVLGDWLGVYFDPRGLRDEDEVGEMPFPGSAETFVLTSDMFALPVASRHRPAAERLLSTVASIEGQNALAPVKGCLSPRSDVDANTETAVQKEKARVLRSGRLVLAMSGRVPRLFHDHLNAALAEMFEQRNVEPVVQTLRSRYGLLKDARR